MHDGLPRMSVSGGGSFARPRDWSALEHLTRDLFARLLGDLSTDLNGRNGQPQSGVDVYGVDRLSGERYGIQCKGRNEVEYGLGKPLSEAELCAEVEKARGFEPPLDHFLLITTGPNDIALQRAARELDAASRANGGFGIAFHAWDWIEGHLAQHVDLAVRYGLVAVSYGTAPASDISPIAREIGGRLQQAVALMNAGLEPEDVFTLQGLARYAGHKDWRRLEQIAAGTADPDVAELETLAEALGLNLLWLLEGKGAPFDIDPDAGHKEIEDIHDEIMALHPERIVLVRQREGGFGHHDAFIVVQRDAVRWMVFRNTHPACGQVGGGGARQLFDLCRLLRRLDYADIGSRVQIMGKHLDSPKFEQLREGEVYPGTFLRFLANDLWWQNFSTLRADWVEGNAPHQAGLRDAISIARDQLARGRKSAAGHEWWRKALAWGHFRMTAPNAEDGEVEPWD